MTAAENRARKSWLLSFGDVTTLLICFFVMMIAVNKGEVARIHTWIEAQLEESRDYIAQQVEQQKLGGVTVSRDAKGVLIMINSPDAFESARTEPSTALKDTLDALGVGLAKTPIFQVTQRYPKIISDAKENGLLWTAEITIEGHTDNDAIATTAYLRSNWELSALRAQKVMQRLQAASQLAEASFSVAGMGEYHPIATNDTPEGKAKNRRIDIRINAALLKISQ
jgi:chemotaxis protein MotB